MGGLRRLDGYDEVLARTDSPFVRWHVDPETVAGGGAWALGAATAFVRRGMSGRWSLTVLPNPADDDAADDAVALLSDLVGDPAGGLRPPFASVTVPRGLPLPPRAAAPGSGWDWFATDTPPPVVPGEDRVVEVPGEEPALAALLAAASPTASLQPGADDGSRWVGWWDGGRLIGCAARDGTVRGQPHLSSVATHPAARGRGVGSALVAALTRRLLADGHPAVTLGVYADNAVAIALYERLGYRFRHRWTSTTLAPSPLAPAPRP